MNTKRISVVIALIVTSTSPITFGDPSPFPNTHSSIETPLSSEIREINSGEAVISEKFTTNSRRHPSFSALNREIGRPDVQQVQLSPGTGRHFQKIRVQAVVHAYRTESSLWLAYPDEDRQFLNEIRNAGIVAPDDQAINVARKVANHAYNVVQDFGVYDHHVPVFVYAAINAYTPNTTPQDRQFLNEIRNAGIVAPDDQAINVARKVANHAYNVVQDFGVYDHHVPAFVYAAINAYTPNTTPQDTRPNARPDEDRQFLNEIHNAGIVAPDDQAINVAHKVVNLVFEDGAPADGQAVYQVVREFGVYDNHIAAFVNAAIRAYGNN
ncbi:DUF732 domain-containing protein [Streptosporangium sp. H16]|uniref:DUF732 domain-containing protein n=1 Tax=Streptosporangium sp. H16 TaxID=3444184 RepID=UPI003F7A8D64